VGVRARGLVVHGRAREDGPCAPAAAARCRQSRGTCAFCFWPRLKVVLTNHQRQGKSRGPHRSHDSWDAPAHNVRGPPGGCGTRGLRGTMQQRTAAVLLVLSALPSSAAGAAGIPGGTRGGATQTAAAAESDAGPMQPGCARRRGQLRHANLTASDSTSLGTTHTSQFRRAGIACLLLSSRHWTDAEIARQTRGRQLHRSTGTKNTADIRRDTHICVSTQPSTHTRRSVLRRVLRCTQRAPGACSGC
jgi:hypothetical protein